MHSMHYRVSNDEKCFFFLHTYCGITQTMSNVEKTYNLVNINSLSILAFIFSNHFRVRVAVSLELVGRKQRTPEETHANTGKGAQTVT